MWDKHTPLEETLSTLDDLVREGKVRYIGASNFAGWHLAKALGISALHGWEPFVCLQPEYSLITRDARARAHPAVPERGPRGHPVEPARRRHPHRQVPEGRRLPRRHAGRRHREPDHVHLPARRPRVEHRRRGEGSGGSDRARRAAQISLNWVLNRRGVTAPIIGARNLDPARRQPRRGRLGARRRVSARSLAWASGFRLGYPYEFIQFADHCQHGPVEPPEPGRDGGAARGRATA